MLDVVRVFDNSFGGKTLFQNYRRMPLDMPRTSESQKSTNQDRTIERRDVSTCRKMGSAG